MKKKITTILLVLALCAALLPATASAYDMGKAGYLGTFSLGNNHSAAIASDGSLYTWGGKNTDGKLGLGDNTDRYTPTKVPGLSGVITVSLGDSHSAAVTSDGSLYTWGNNKHGQLGLGDSGNGTERNKPTKVTTLSNVAAICLGSDHSAAITTDGSLYTWGWNNYGQLGLGDKTDRITPVKVPGLSGVVAASLSLYNGAAITSDGSLYVWGYTAGGKSEDTPSKVSGLSDVIAVSLGRGHFAAVTSDGSLYTWGNNDSGQLGFGDKTNRNTPTKVAGLSNVVAVALGGWHSAAITADGSLYIWGISAVGNNSTPTLVAGLSGVIAISLGMSHSAAMTADGSLYTGGNNIYGGLGLGDTTDRNSITQMAMADVKLPTITIPEDNVSVPAASPKGGIYADAQTVTLTCATDGADIHYSIDGTTPTTASTKYTTPLKIEKNTTIKAIAVKTGMSDSDVMLEVYIISPKPEGSYDNFLIRNLYKPGQFTDVDENAWYGYYQQKVIANAYDYGMMKGSSATTFNPTGVFTIAEAVTVAARVHSIYMTGMEDFVQGSTWYQVYVDYAIKNGIIKTTDFTNYNTPATRAQMAYIFAHCLPDSCFAKRTDTKTPPDVNSATPYQSDILKLYGAGILGGSDGKGTFKPSDNITRAESAAVIARVILPGTRFGK